MQLLMGDEKNRLDESVSTSRVLYPEEAAKMHQEEVQSLRLEHQLYQQRTLEQMQELKKQLWSALEHNKDDALVVQIKDLQSGNEQLAQQAAAYEDMIRTLESQNFVLQNQSQRAEQLPYKSQQAVEEAEQALRQDYEQKVQALQQRSQDLAKQLLEKTAQLAASLQQLSDCEEALSKRQVQQSSNIADSFVEDQGPPKVHRKDMEAEIVRLQGESIKQQQLISEQNRQLEDKEKALKGLKVINQKYFADSEVLRKKVETYQLSIDENKKKLSEQEMQISVLKGDFD